MSDAAEELRGAVLSRCGSVHAFCRCHPDLKRSTVYMVLGGRYPGKMGPQLAKIRAALMGTEVASPAPGLPTATAMATALQDIRCKHCRTLDKHRCGVCRSQTIKESQELHAHLAGDV